MYIDLSLSQSGVPITQLSLGVNKQFSVNMRHKAGTVITNTRGQSTISVKVALNNQADTAPDLAEILVT